MFLGSIWESTTSLCMDYTSSTDTPNEYPVLSSALLTISMSGTAKNRSQRKLLKKSGPNIEPWGTP